MNIIKAINGQCIRGVRFAAFRIFNIQVLCSLVFSASALANTTTITAGMNPAVADEFNVAFNNQLKLQHSTFRSVNLAMMSNPYGKFMEEINEKIGDKTDERYHPDYQRRLMTRDENILSGKSARFGECQRVIVRFITLAKSAHYRVNNSHDMPPTKTQIMQGFGVEYPFIADEKNDGTTRPIQIALELGWQYQGQGEEHVDTFVKTCLDIPISLYYWEDKFEYDE